MNKRSAYAMVIVVGSTVALFLVIIAFQYYQSLVSTSFSLFTLSPDDAISIVVREKENKTNYDNGDYSVTYVNIKGNGDVYSAKDSPSPSDAKYIGKAEPTITGGSYFAWKVTDTKSNSTYYVDRSTGDIVSQSVKR